MNRRHYTDRPPGGKHETPKTKHQTPNISSAASVGFWFLKLGIFLVFGAWCLVFPAPARASSRPVALVAKWGRFEQAFRSPANYTNPVQDVALSAVFTSPLGETMAVNGFWDGGNIWRVRFSPDQPGKWTFKTFCSDRTNTALNNVTGEFLCTSAGVRSRFELHGPVRVARDGRHLEHLDRTPFLWLSDTVWGSLAAKPEEWNYYAQVRAYQKFSVAQWAAAPGRDLKGRAPWSGAKRISINPEYFKQLDARVELLNRAGLLSAIAPLREGPASSPADALPEDQAILLLRYMVARWGANDVAWIMPCEGDAPGRNEERCKRIGRAVFGGGSHAPVILDPGETYWVLDEFRREPWVDLFGYESGQGMTEDTMQWMVAGPVTRDWMKEPHRPIVNLAAPFENERASQSPHRATAFEVRRAIYWSLLNAPSAGVGYGSYGVWNWVADNAFTAKPVSYNALPMWQKCLFLPAAKQMAGVVAVFGGIDFWRLRPAPDLVASQPGLASPGRHVAAARTEAGDLALVYVPQEKTVELASDALPPLPAAVWINARTGERAQARAAVRAKTCQFPTPGEGDWVLWLTSTAPPKPPPGKLNPPIARNQSLSTR